MNFQKLFCSCKSETNDLYPLKFHKDTLSSFGEKLNTDLNSALKI